MSESLCRWMNQKLRLSRALESTKFAKDFSNGYLIGEILHKHGMQDDFYLFLKKNTSIAKVSNFRRLEPTLKQLRISFDSSIAEDLMREKEGAATRLLYQLYASLEKDAEVSSAVMKTPSVFTTNQKPPQEVKPHAGLKLPKLSQPSEDKCHQVEFNNLIPPFKQTKPLKAQDETSMKSTQKVQQTLHQTEHKSVIPPIQQREPLIIQYETGMKRKEKEVQTEIVQFAESQRKLGATASTSSDRLFRDAFRGGITERCKVPGSGNESSFQFNTKYIQGIRHRLDEEAVASERREKHISNFLVQQLKALETRQEAQRDELIVRRLTRHSKLEQRLISQLMQVHRQKQVIQDHSEYGEQQRQQRREKDAQEALYREMVLSQQAELAREEEIRKTIEFFHKSAAEHAQRRQKKHFDGFKDLLLQIVDLAINVGQYRQLIENLIPYKLMKGWMELFIRGLPLYQPVKGSQQEIQSSASLDSVEVRKQEILNNLDYDEYTNMSGEWALATEAETPNLPQSHTYCVEHVVQKLKEIVSPPVVEPTPPLLPNVTFKACVLGKCFSGKTTCLVKIAEELGICILSAETLIEEALKAYKSEELCKSSITDALLVDVMVRAVSQLPAQSDWILDGFPYNIVQADLLEKALGGSVDEEDETADLAEDPDPLERPPCPAPILDLALLLDVSDECAVRRAHSHGDATISQPTEKILYLSDIQSRIVAFHEAWPELERWFGEKQNILLRVGGDEGDLYSMVKSVLEQAIQKKREVCFESTQGVLQNQSESTCSTPASLFQPNAENPIPLVGSNVYILLVLWMLGNLL
ncbi:sperm flagellar protein 2-like [Nothobranchius furzeri]|uniref:Sperm flagellar protein 2-like n=2 Tax=Nothobranchius furzeri TaxID=105023 RepID=A0A9D2XF81_NOTFU|nr:sperm flagellar protein 2-like [Nothobranchius furzeri]